MPAERVNLEHARSRVAVIPYTEEWVHLFERERQVLAVALGEAATDIHHIGSTSVPGLAAKDTLDILAVTPAMSLVLQRELALDDAGYQIKGPYDGRAHHYFLRRLEGGRRRVHLHVVEVGQPEIAEYLLFRNFLRADSTARDDYAAYKLGLAQTSRDREEYVTTKQRFVTLLLEQARAWQASSTQ